DDIFQEVFLKFYTKVHQLKNGEKLTSWIYQITRNTIADHYRNSTRMAAHEIIEWEGRTKSLNECAEQCVKELLATLPEKYRRALELSELDNRSQIELSKTLNISYSGAKSRVQRARQMLRARVDEKYQIKTDGYGNVIVCKDKLSCGCSESSPDSCE
ncbi:MAG TPA: sigma-70 family RNA polymerase sigma factor, partial [Cyclobacteriaceae bacterium]|nr:sigma-70 family RNA polymerase sigma factor [Cyclobacteriaceae bacterium]